MPRKHDSNSRSHGPVGKPRLFSYLRFSSPEQAFGDSERRQLDDAKRYADARGLTFDETLTDRGLSGYHGAHRTKGALGRFLLRVKAGDVPPGSILVVENVDRLSREGVWRTLKDVVFALVENGITLHFLSSGIDFDRNAPNDWRCQYLVSELQRAHAESQRKSELSKSNWRQKQKQAGEDRSIVTGMCPAWLRVTEAGRFEPIPEAAECVRLIFNLKLQGIGLGTIEQRLNREARWTPPLKKGGRPKKDATSAAKQKTRGWRISYLKKILTNPAVTGAYQPYASERDEGTGKRVRIKAGEAVAGYFPVIVQPALFQAVQARLEANHHKGGRLGRVNNLLAHLATCAYCGGPMAFADRGSKGNRWILCDRGRRGEHQDGQPVCSRHSMSYREVEALVLENCPELRPEDVLPDPDEQDALRQSLRRQLEGKRADLNQIERQMDNLVSQIADTDAKSLRTRYEAKLQELEDRKAALGAETATEEKQLEDAERSSSSFTRWQKNLSTLKKALAKGDVEVRLKTRAHLRELIDRIEVFAIGHKKRFDPEAERKVMAEYREKLHSQGRPLDPAEYRHDEELQRQLHDARDGENIDRALWDLLGEHFSEQLQDKTYCREFEAFVEHLLQRRRTKEGRFIRVWFKGGGRADLVPQGSLASGLKLRQDGVTFINPDFGKLFDDFRAQHQTNGKRRQG